MTLCFTMDASAITIDGDFDTTEWAGYYADEDFVGSGGYVGPGWGGQDFDVERLGLQFTTNGTLYFGLRTGFDVINGVDYGGSHYTSGDFAFDVNTDGTYDFAVDFSFTGTTPNFSLYRVSDWQDVLYAAHAVANPFEYDSTAGTEALVLAPTDIAGAYGVDGTSYILEGSFDLSALEYTDLGLYAVNLYSGGDISMRWTMSCGNDFLEITTAPIPEPSTYLLLGSGIIGLAFWRRRRAK